VFVTQRQGWDVLGNEPRRAPGTTPRRRVRLLEMCLRMSSASRRWPRLAPDRAAAPRTQALSAAVRPARAAAGSAGILLARTPGCAAHSPPAACGRPVRADGAAGCLAHGSPKPQAASLRGHPESQATHPPGDAALLATYLRADDASS
jgi:hypothetical protein